MIIEESFVVSAPRDRTAAFFLDVPRVAACVPGVRDVREAEPGTYAATLAIALGPIKSAFQGQLTIDDTDAPGRLVAVAEGRDRSTGSMATITFTARLEQQETEAVATQVHTNADVALRGRLAQFGTGVVRSAATELVRQFAHQVNASINSAPADRAADRTADRTAGETTGATAGESAGKTADKTAPAAQAGRSGGSGTPAAHPPQQPLAAGRLLRVVLVDYLRTLATRLRQVWTRRGRRSNVGTRR